MEVPLGFALPPFPLAGEGSCPTFSGISHSPAFHPLSVRFASCLLLKQERGEHRRGPARTSRLLGTLQHRCQPLSQSQEAASFRTLCSPGRPLSAWDGQNLLRTEQKVAHDGTSHRPCSMPLRADPAQLLLQKALPPCPGLSSRGCRTHPSRWRCACLWQGLLQAAVPRLTRCLVTPSRSRARRPVWAGEDAAVDVQGEDSCPLGGHAHTACGDRHGTAILASPHLPLRARQVSSWGHGSAPHVEADKGLSPHRAQDPGMVPQPKCLQMGPRVISLAFVCLSVRPAPTAPIFITAGPGLPDLWGEAPRLVLQE